MKTHVSFRTRDLERTTAFYSALLNADPVKRYGDYVLFITEEPGLELALSPDPHVSPDLSEHFGIAVERPDAVDAAIARLKSAGLPLDIETGEICCYARQNKVWATDPDGRRWEVYHVLEESADPMSEDSTCCAEASDDAESAACCPA